MNSSRIIPNSVNRILEGQNPVIWKGSELSIREFIHVDDVVDAYLSLVSNIDKTSGEAYNIGSGDKITIEALLELIIAKIDKNIKIDYLEKEFPEISQQFVDSSKISKTTGWSASISLDEGIERVISFMRERN
jgi:nucleoside-diphosphate-sugar epimerase